MKRPSDEIIRNYIIEEGVGVGFPADLLGTDTVFVYGTLQPGYGLFRLIKDNVVSCMPDTYAPNFEMYASGYPWAVHSEGNIIWGTLLFIKNPVITIGEMDSIELGAGYVRERVPIRSLTAGELTAWIYTWHNAPVGEKVKNGDYVGWSYLDSIIRT